MAINHSDGLASSLLLYATAVSAVFALFAIPVVWLSSGTKLENPGLAAYDPPYGATLIRREDPNILQLARLKQSVIIDAAQLAALNTRAQKVEKPKRTARRDEEATETEARELPVRERTTRYAQPRGFFGLF